MIRISSSFTLVLSIFIPVFWFVFFGSLCLFFVLQDPEDLPFSNPRPIKLGFIAFYLFFGFCIYYFLFQLRRVELDDSHIYITNYFKTIKLPLDQVDTFSTVHLIGMYRVKVRLAYERPHGKNIRFICNQERFDYFKSRIEPSQH